MKTATASDRALSTIRSQIKAKEEELKALWSELRSAQTRLLSAKSGVREGSVLLRGKERFKVTYVDEWDKGILVFGKRLKNDGTWQSREQVMIGTFKVESY